MRKMLALTTAWILLSSSISQASPDPVSILSPDGTLTFRLQPGADDLLFTILTHDKPLILPSPLRFLLDSVLITGNTRIQTIKKYAIHEKYPWLGAHSTAIDECNGAEVQLLHGNLAFTLDIRVFDNGAAFRVIVPGAASARRVPDEATVFRLPGSSTIWYHDLNGHYEGVHVKKELAQVQAGEWVAPPATIKLPLGIYIAITEANLQDYSGIALQADGKSGLEVRMAHHQPASHPYVLRYSAEDVARLARPAVIRGTITTPWRVVMVGHDLNALVNNDMVPDLCSAPDPTLFPKGVQTSWIHPGRAVWKYLDGGGEGTPEVMKRFTDQAARLGFEHNILEGFWKKWTDEQLKDLVDYSRKKNVGIWLWEHSKTLRDPAVRRSFFQHCHDLGVTGLKIDFFDHEAKEVIDLYTDILKEAATFHLLVDFHGSNKPTGLSRTWPNEMTREAVKGMEASKLDDRATHETTIPFTRLLAGPAEYTVVHFGPRRKNTSYTHQLASAVILGGAPLLTYAANPDTLLASPALPIIQKIPAGYDETIVLPGSAIGEMAAFARRKGNTWFLAVMNGAAPKKITIPLSFLSTRTLAQVIKDAGDTLATATATFTPADHLDLDLAPGGGYLAMFGQPETPQDRWAIQTDGSIEWQPDNRLPHFDHIEMSGQQVSCWVQYGVGSDGHPTIDRTLVFPTFRLLPNNTTGSMMYNVTDNDLPRFLINNRLMRAGTYNANVAPDMPERVLYIRHNGVMEIGSEIGREGNIQLHRTLFPSVDKPMALEKWVFTNTGRQPVKVEMEYLRREERPAPERTTPALHSFILSTIGEGIKTIPPGDSATFTLVYQAADAARPFRQPDPDTELAGRRQRIRQIGGLLQLETPDTILNTAFAFAKVRATESLYNTKGGLIHSPGGLRYYAAIWANDQAEYVNPFFAFLGDSLAGRAAMTAYRWFAKYMNPEYHPIPSSIVAEGDDTWHGRGDRGDMAMIAYGAGRYALTCGNKDSARVLWPLIEWCLEYLHRQINANGVVASNSDELEGRLPSGKANLNTSSLYYDALRSAALLGRELGIPAQQLKEYDRAAQQIRNSIEKFFGATVEGYPTYRYYDSNTVLRAWICTPLTVDIFDRKEGTIAALFSPRLWTEDGLASLAGDKTFWDRSTLYALRGVFAAGATEKALSFLQYYSRRRLLGEHVPYPVEAYPEGNQRHLSAESGLYCRIYTEGLFGMRPTGLSSFDCTPRLPAAWDHMALKNIHAFGQLFDLTVTRTAKPGWLSIKVSSNGHEKIYTLREGATQRISF